MRAIYCLLGVVLSAVSHAPSAEVSTALASAPQEGILKTVASSTAHSALFGLAFDGSRGIAVGVKGAIHESADGGKTWKAVDKTPTQTALLAVATQDGRAIAVGLTGTVLVSERANAWERVDSGSTARLISVDLNPAGLVVAGGEFGAVIVSRDGGRSWTPGGPDWSAFVTPENLGAGEPMIYAVSVSDDGQITLAGEFGLIVRSDDSGSTWRVLRSPVKGEPTINGMFIQPAGANSYAVGQEGELLISADGGETWGRCTTGTKLNFLGVGASANGQVVVSGMRVMYRSVNGGMTWDQVTEGDAATEWYQSVRVEPDSGRIYLVGHSGRIVQVGT